jgi:hypothetical protein
MLWKRFRGAGPVAWRHQFLGEDEVDRVDLGVIGALAER